VCECTGDYIVPTETAKDMGRICKENSVIIIIRISHFSALAGKYSPILGCIINRIRLGGLMCKLGKFLQLNMCQELPLFAFVYMYYYYYYYYYY
jgi:hypothetical protein